MFATQSRCATSILLLLLGACATVDIDQSVDQVNATAAAFTQGKLQRIVTAEQQLAAEALSASLLETELDQDAAVRLALANHPAMQALIAEHWAAANKLAQEGRIPNPVLALERIKLGSELEISQSLSFGLIDVLTYPLRYRQSRSALIAQQFELTTLVVDEITLIRQAWVDAVAARQQLRHAEQIFESTQASAELARRMRAAGNFSELARARQQVFHSDATIQLAQARHTATAAREALTRKLGLQETQRRALKLPDQLPPITEELPDPVALGGTAIEQRLDVQAARAAYQAAIDAQGLGRIASFTDIEVGALHQSVEEGDERQSAWGVEAEIVLPLFDWGDLKREQLDARSLARAAALEATLRGVASTLREQYSAWRTSQEIALHYQNEVTPLQQTIIEEAGLRYNGMLVGVFELLAGFREQAGSRMRAIEAYRSFWLADAAMQATLFGGSTGSPSSPAMTMPSDGGADEAH